jgi:hypothetical protein
MGVGTCARLGGRRPFTVVVAATALLALVVAGWWASRQGYVSWTGEHCTVEGYDPVPTHEELVSQYGKSPYCARLTRGEAWF